MGLQFHTSYARYASEAIKNDGQVDGFTHAGSGIARSSFWPTFANLVVKLRGESVFLVALPSFGSSTRRALNEVSKTVCSPLGSASCETYQRKVVNRAP